MRVAVTGAGGMLGQALVPALESAGHECLALTKAVADVTRLEDLRAALRPFRPQWVFNLAAFTRVHECETPEGEKHAFRVNDEGAGNVARAAAEVEAAVMMVSTDYVFSGVFKGKRRPYVEEDKPAPKNPYGRSKLAGERATQGANKRFVILRTAWLYGEGGRNFPDSILRRAEAGEPLSVVKDQEGSPTWTVDLAKALMRFPAIEEFGIYHCTSSGSCTWFEFAKYLIGRTRLEVPVKPISSSDLEPHVDRPSYSVLSNARFERATGYRMPTWKESIDRYLLSRGAAKTAAREEM